MRKINIYSPTYYRLDKTRDSIDSIIDSMGMSENDVKLYITDNNSPNDMKDWLNTKASENVIVELLNSNVGKGEAINRTHKKARPSDYIISIDSDMVNNHKINWIDMMVDIMEKDGSLGLVASDFSEYGGSAHNWQALRIPKQVDKYNLLTGIDGLAGGCIILHSNDFTSLGGYTNSDIYIGDDAKLVEAVVNRLGKIAGVCKDIKLLHPPPKTEKEDKYQRWKFQKAHRSIEWNKQENSGFYENS
jgi:GT2 family glycosyltransferase